MESFPIQFCTGIRSYWRSRRYQKLRNSATGNKTRRVTRLGNGTRSSTRRFRLRSVFRIRFKFRVFSPLRIIARIRDAYVDSMLGIAGKGAPGLLGSGGPECMLGRRIPKARLVRPEPGDFEKRLVLEIYKSVMASRELRLDAL
ncbi:uncharacterized protein A4U43_UnF9360 [Asparagus officinalis]|uniref:Uncharacterized protein n=1 Tax=Asparagus officinalis TaxID=4686 RepID=A0A1R3L5Q2_ASPOF|nr:uncharacterized protein LOC109828002 [Asparagus officinalis]ONK54951.1 uncharacterized protein A4U43_UnF9360 [Asparagus officinalis]